MTSMPSELFAEGNMITVDIIDRARDRVGPGPLMSCMSLDCDRILSQAGRFTARFPANDPRLAYLQLKKHFLDFYVDNELVHFGVAESWNVEINDEGQQVLVVSGRDALGELDEISIDFTPIEEGAAPVFDAPTRIGVAFQLAGGGGSEVWGVSGDTETAVYGSFAGESALKALTKIAEHIGESFRLTARGAIEWLGTATADSGIHAVQGVGDPVEAEGNPNICLIQRLTERRDATRMFTAIHPYGAGLGETRLDLAGTTRTAPTGFTLSEADNYISSDAAVTYLGQSITRHVNFKDIRPLYNTDADVESAKNYLFDAALAYLKRNDSVDDIVEYDLDVVMLPPRLLVGQTLRVIYQDDRYDLDTDLVVLGIRRNVNSNGVIAYGLTVATTNQWRLRESSALVAQLEEGEIFAGHPQIDASSYWENFREEIGDDQTDHIAEMPFVLAEEVVTIRQVLFRYKVDRIVGLVKSYALSGTDTQQNSAANTGGASVTIDLNSAGSTNSASAGTSDLNSAGSTNSAFAGTTDLNTAGSTNSGFSGTSDANATPLNTGNNSVAGDPHTHTIATHSHANTTFSHSHVLPQHSHASTTFSHSHVLPQHSHLFTNTHAHIMPQHSHTNTAHIHSSPQHVHVAPTLVETIGMVRVPVLNSYVMADLEYSVNGGGWVSLDTGTPVAGGYYQADITSSIQNPDGKRRPIQENNLVQVRRKTAAGAGKTAMIRVKLGVRSTIQSIAIFS